jgi:uncharacterized protein (TIGR02117 family)
MTRLFAITSPLTALRALVGWPLLLLGFYMFAALVGSMVPRNADWQEAPDGAMIWLHNSGIHTSIVVACAPPSPNPDNADLVRCLFPEGHARGDPTQVRYQLIGWGDRDFFLSTPRWRDLRPGTALSALAGSGRMLLHVENLRDLPADAIKPIRLTERELLSVLTRLQDPLSTPTVPYPPGQEPSSLAIPGYGPDDWFYEAQAIDGRSYSALYTCNNWVSDILATAGIRTALWSPFPGGVMRWLPDPPSR